MYQYSGSSEVLLIIPILFVIFVVLAIVFMPRRGELRKIWKGENPFDLFSPAHLREHELVAPFKFFSLIAVFLFASGYYLFENCGINLTISEWFHSNFW